MVSLAEWGVKWQNRGQLEQIVDTEIAGSLRPESLWKFCETIEKCLADTGVERPSVQNINSKSITELVSQVQNINTVKISPRMEADI
ncbi:receptor-like protein kinase HERK 1 [Canna indica]|uniref:Receptor-like protein kinase HERK 1 n=1 Tax=Canna indica TaxID=4628 RepID=A0AAQ3QP37_9LILI|nr:receptor-like protein kinase HERK 1 [Canna indica]